MSGRKFWFELMDVIASTKAQVPLNDLLVQFIIFIVLGDEDIVIIVIFQRAERECSRHCVRPAETTANQGVGLCRAQVVALFDVELGATSIGASRGHRQNRRTIRKSLIESSIQAVMGTTLGPLYELVVG